MGFRTGVRFPSAPSDKQDLSWVNRGVAQFGRALRSGRRGRKFESCHLDYGKDADYGIFFVFLRYKTYKNEYFLRKSLQILKTWYIV